MGTQQHTNTFAAQRDFFDSGATLPFSFRLEQLLRLKAAIKAYEADIVAALQADLRKPELEAYSSEVGFVYEEINVVVRNLRRWMRPKRVPTPLALWPSSSWIQPSPLGVVLIVGPWNYPLHLVMAPLVAAIAAGNCVMLKPSEKAPHTAHMVERIVQSTFEPQHVACVRGSGAAVVPQLLESLVFNHIFFTGSPAVGRRVMAMAAQNLTPVTLELGGKSPAIVHSDANLEVAAQRIVWAKMYNAGQTCIAPDYLLVHRGVKDKLVEHLRQTINQFYGDQAEQSPYFGRIVNHQRLSVLLHYTEQGRILHGGRHSTADLFIEPTLIDDVRLDSPIMQEEIFGPILPIITYDTIDEAIGIIRQRRHPLALYLFCKSKRLQKQMLSRVEFGGGAVNNAMLHIANPNLPFGGVGNSGMGRYHGKYGFECMSHLKSIVRTPNWPNIKIVLPPYTSRKLNIIKKFLK